MKKGLFVLIISLLVLSIIPIAKAVEDPSDTSQVIGSEFGINPDAIPTDPDQIKAQYLKQEWAELLNKSAAGPYIAKAQNAIQSIDPFFNVLLGLPFAFSWFFFITIALWIALLTSGINLLTILEVYFKPKNYAVLAKWIAVIILFIALSTVRIPRYLAAGAISIISLAGHWAIQLILALVLLIIVIFLAQYTRTIKRKFLKIKEAKKIKSSAKEIKEQEKETEKLKENLQKGKYQKKSMREEAEEQAREEFEGIGESE